MPDQPLEPGTLLHGRYRIRERLGASRASVTYLAEDTSSSSGETCVVKELSVGQVVRGARGEHSFDPADFTKLIELFEREARVLEHLDHPAIPRLLDHFTVASDPDTRLYIVQERVPGRTLAELVASGKHVDEKEARSICRQVAEVLEYIHGLSPPLIHRDVKPSNVMMDAAGGVHLIDFGSVRSAVQGADADGMTVVGTFGYMPMEQFESRALPASDLYALGGTLVFLLTHRPPTELPRKGLRPDLRPHVNVSGGFAAILERMLEPSLDRRYRSATEVLRDLERLERGSLLPGVGRGVRVAATTALLLAGGWSAWTFLDGPDEPLPARGAPATPGPGLPAEAPPAPGPVQAEGGTLTVDIYRQFMYSPRGWPMGRSVGQTGLRLLGPEPLESVVVPEHLEARGVERHFGAFPLGNAEDRLVSFVLFREDGDWGLYADENNNEDLTDDGPPVSNQGTGKIMATNLNVQVDVVTAAGPVRRPYHLWVWFDPPEDARGRIRGRFYATNHYLGRVGVEDATYDAVAFEFQDHDGLYRDGGLCIDLDRDGTCQEDRELFFDGTSVPFPEGPTRLVLAFP